MERSQTDEMEPAKWEGPYAVVCEGTLWGIMLKNRIILHNLTNQEALRLAREFNETVEKLKTN